MSDLAQGLSPRQLPSTSAPPSTGKTMIIAGSVPIAAQEMLVDIGNIYGWAWLTPHFASNLMILAVALAGMVMHNSQRLKEKKELQNE